MRTFEMVREGDETGVSGTGKVLEGCIYSDGTCVVRWVTDNSPRSTQIWESLASFIAIHITPHPDNKTKLVFSDGEIYEQGKAGRVGGVGPVQGVQRRKRARKAPIPGVGLPQPEAAVRESNVPAKSETVLRPEGAKTEVKGN
jgi:hypothetical protein